MNILLDTHTLLWSLTNSKHLPEDIKNIICDTNNDVFVSTASLWEIEIKHQKNPELMPFDSDQVLKAIFDSDYGLLNITYFHILGLKEIISQKIHNDPFDHLLLSIAKKEQMMILTHDELINKYDGVNITKY